MSKEASTSRIVEPLASEKLKTAEVVRKTERAKSFAAQMRYYSSRRLAEQAHTAQLEDLARQALEKRQQQQRINSLLGQISMLKGRLYLDGFDSNLAGQLSMLQSELLWLLCVA